MTTLGQRWRNVELAMVSLRWPNGQNYVRQRRKSTLGQRYRLPGQRWANIVVLSAQVSGIGCFAI